METLSVPGKSQKHKGALRGTAYVLKTVAKDPKTQRAAREVGSGIKTVGRAGAGITKEIAKNEEVRKAARHTGWLALEGAGVVRYDTKTGKRVPHQRGIERALTFPGFAVEGALDAAIEGVPRLTEAALRAAPNALRNYSRDNTSVWSETTSATLEAAKGAVTIPFYMGVAAVNGIREVRATNRTLEEDAARYRELVAQPTSAAPVSDFTVHTAKGPVHTTFGVPFSPEQQSPQSTIPPKPQPLTRQ